MPLYSHPAKHLVGITIKDEWKVIELIDTDSPYSTSYIVNNGETEAWLKAIDLSEAEKVSSEDVDMIAETISSFRYETSILEKCRDHNLKNIVRIIDKGEIVLDEFSYPKVFYIILEKGLDIRKELDYLVKMDYAWLFRAIHQISVGLNQLHKLQIAHQDIKPANIISFPNNVKKIADLGSAHCQTLTESIPTRLEKNEIAGTPLYAPLELLYGEISTSWEVRRRACDMFHLGNLIVFLLTKVSITSLIKKHLVDDLYWEHHYNIGRYRELLYLIIQAYERALLDVSNDLNDEYLITNLIPVIRQLCHPDPELRGHPKSIDQLGSNYSLERYITIFNRFATHYELKL